MKSLGCLKIFGVVITMSCFAVDAKENKEQLNTQQIETIVVTGELIERPIYKVANSADILDQETLNNRAGLETLRDVLDASVNVSVVTGTGKAPTVRGIDGTGASENANAFFAGSRSRLNWQFDNRPASYSEIVFGDIGIFDLERIEVLKGAQSTLVGRNAIAGTVIVKTNDPSFDNEVTFQVAGGNYDQRRTSAMVNVPIIDDQVAVRLSGDLYKKESAVNYTPYEGVSNPGESEALSLRGKVLFTPDFAPKSKLLLTVSHTDYTSPNSEIIVKPFEERESNFPNQPVHNPKTTAVSADFDTQLSEALHFTLSTSTTELAFKRHAVPGSSNATINSRDIIVEPRLHYTQESGFSIVGGLHFFKADQDETIEYWGGQAFKDKSDTIAAYTEGLIPLSDTLDLSFGLRYEKDHHQRHGGDETGTLVQISSDETYTALLPKLGINWQQTEENSWGAQISRGYNAGGGGITFTFPIVNYEYDAEYVWTTELYGRQDLLDGRLFFTQNIFYSDYQDMQLPFDLTPNDARDEAFVVRNADRVNTSGVELGATFSITPNLDGFMNIGLLNTKVTKYPNSGVEGNELLTAPNFTSNMGLSWTKNNWSTSFVARYTSGYFTDVNNRPNGKTNSYVIADAKISYTFKDLRVFGTIKNIGDIDDAVARYPGVAPSDSNQPDSDFDSAVLVQPRSFLVGVEVSF
ncbi:TonB-dependent receptor [Colwellia sp. E2M01]|uniref:TonB-dependent receptor n=1 Tax=Colwellia sp. E2M01 TaxID=2841561 RepID=UPI001C089A33|nr:TonB-dependent receptor [Colwellia sp. E2M01]MBU2869854.1 TonB-dependent receptor [Colwellia sp. E2M01]